MTRGGLGIAPTSAPLTPVHHLIAEDDYVVAHSTSRGLHTGELFGIAPSGRPFSFTAISIYGIADGRIAEAWYAEDTLGLLDQLGALPTGLGSARQLWRSGPQP